MADKQAWNDRSRLLSMFQGLQQCLDNFKIFAKELNIFKTEVLGDVDRKAELMKLIDEDPDWDLTLILNKYNYFKEIYEYLAGK